MREDWGRRGLRLRWRGWKKEIYNVGFPRGQDRARNDDRKSEMPW